MTQPPTGTVTFLFTDIEGSTKLWQQHPDTMPAALARHHALLHEAIAAHGGYVFQIIGDAFCAAFSSANDGLDAALDAQCALATEKWGENGAIRVRMALHTGQAEVQEGEYTSGEYASGLTLSRAARLLSAGHGGQILLSLPAAELARDHLPQGTTLRDLGIRRLKDLIHPEQIFQVVAPGLPSDFAPLKTLDVHPHNLPVQLTSFIGREQELGEIKRLLTSTRLLTLTGIGGTGKTRLELQASADMIDEFPDGVWLVELAPISDPALIEQTVASVLGIREKPDRLLSNLLVEDLRNKHLLLILDNCEHLVEACVRLIIDLLRACPKLFTIASSREALGIRGEIVYNVPTLSLPDLPGDPVQLTAMMRNESCQLFIERAMAVQAHFQLNLDHAKAIIQICRRLDGIPLAIEMAAARMKMLSAEQIAARLDARFRLLTDGERTAHARQKTLRALIDWSYDLLLEPEQALFGRLSVFAGGWSLEAAEEVCTGAMPFSSPDHSASGGNEPLDVFELLGQLVSKSMVVIDFDPAGETRYRYLETIRQYAREKLVQANELEFYLERHFQYFFKLTKRAESFLESTDQVIWMDRIERDYDDIRSALRWSIDHKRIVEGLQLTQALKIFWYTRGYFSEGRDWLGELLGLAKEPTLERVLALDQAGFLARYQCDFEAAAGFIGEALTIWRTLGNSKGQADSLANLGYVILFQGDLERAYILYEESLQINRSLNNQQGIADALSHLGMIAFYRGDFEQAYQLHEESLSIWRKLGDRTGISHALNRLASVAFESGRPEETYQLALESLSLAWDLKYREGIAWVLELFAIYCAQTGRWKQAVRLEAIYTKYRQVVGLPQSPAQRRLLSNRLAPVHAALSQNEFEQAWASGENTPVEQLVLKILAGKHINEINSDN